jgi:hypothetical protein
MSSTNEPRRDARHCPTCGALGIVSLEQTREANGAIQDPTMLCPIRELEFRATGMRYLVARPPEGFGPLSDREADAGDRAFVDGSSGRQEDLHPPALSQHRRQPGHEVK